MVNPGAFVGSRKEFLISQKFAYTMAVGSDYVTDAIARITRSYLKRYPIDLPHDEEPSEEFLKAVNDDAPDVEPEEPNRDLLSESEYQAAVEKLQARKKLLDYRKAQIKRWFAYQYTKDNDIRSKEAGAYTPYTALMKKLIGSDCVKPRMKSTANVWRKAERDRIERALKTELLEQQRLGITIPASQYAAMRDKIARQMFTNLDEEVKRVWLRKAQQEHNDALEAYGREINDNPSADPADRQRAIQGLTKFMQPILDMGCAVTGWKMSLIAGGPEPALGGQLSSLSIHSGYTSGDIKMTFGRAERARYKKHVIPIFGNFLQQCYTPDECRSRALPDDDGFMPMSVYEPETDEVAFININTPHFPQVNHVGKVTSNQPSNVPTLQTSSNSTTNAASNSAPVRTKPIRKVQITQDALPADSNPFPFEESYDDPPASPPPTAPPSPALSRQTSPAPAQHLNNSTSISDIQTNSAPSTNEGLAAVVTKRKRGVLEEVQVFAEGSKRARTRTTRSIVAEEQNLVGKKKKVDKETPALPTIGRGKENRKPGGKKGASKGGKSKSSKRH